jgi:hypothetical protein
MTKPGSGDMAIVGERFVGRFISLSNFGQRDLPLVGRVMTGAMRAAPKMSPARGETVTPSVPAYQEKVALPGFPSEELRVLGAP